MKRERNWFLDRNVITYRSYGPIVWWSYRIHSFQNWLRSIFLKCFQLIFFFFHLLNGVFPSTMNVFYCYIMITIFFFFMHKSVSYAWFQLIKENILFFFSVLIRAKKHWTKFFRESNSSWETNLRAFHNNWWGGTINKIKLHWHVEHMFIYIYSTSDTQEKRAHVRVHSWTIYLL